MPEDQKTFRIYHGYPALKKGMEYTPQQYLDSALTRMPLGEDLLQFAGSITILDMLPLGINAGGDGAKTVFFGSGMWIVRYRVQFNMNMVMADMLPPHVREGTMYQNDLISPTRIILEGFADTGGMPCASQ